MSNLETVQVLHAVVWQVASYGDRGYGFARHALCGTKELAEAMKPYVGNYDAAIERVVLPESTELVDYVNLCDIFAVALAGQKVSVDDGRRFLGCLPPPNNWFPAKP